MSGRDTSAAFVGIVRAWQRGRTEESKRFTMRGFASFAEFMNKQTRELIAFADQKDPDFWGALAELANQAATITTTEAKFIVDGKDMKNA